MNALISFFISIGGIIVIIDVLFYLGRFTPDKLRTTNGEDD